MYRNDFGANKMYVHHKLVMSMTFYVCDQINQLFFDIITTLSAGRPGDREEDLQGLPAGQGNARERGAPRSIEVH